MSGAARVVAFVGDNGWHECDVLDDSNMRVVTQRVSHGDCGCIIEILASLNKAPVAEVCAKGDEGWEMTGRLLRTSRAPRGDETGQQSETWLAGCL